METYMDDELLMETVLDPDVLDMLENADDFAADMPQGYGIREASLL